MTQEEQIESLARELADEFGYRWEPCEEYCDNFCDCLGIPEDHAGEEPSRDDFRRLAKRAAAILLSTPGTTNSGGDE
ncbi:MAG: hypothetical protein H0X69_17285 [Gemmatimonadales bacterium]|nr:hypothetical protein [Gemmatimonadales bacterium]